MTLRKAKLFFKKKKNAVVHKATGLFLLHSDKQWFSDKAQGSRKPAVILRALPRQRREYARYES